jgi:hypothetical protein
LIAAHYIRINAADLNRCRTEQSFFEQVVAGDYDDCEAFVDEDTWDALAWMLSDSSRERAVCVEQMYAAMRGEFSGQPKSPTSIPYDQMEQAFKGSRDKLHPHVHFGFGPATYVKPNKLKAIVEQLMTLRQRHLREAFDPAAMNGVHPDGHWPQCGPEILDEKLIPAFESFRKFLLATTQESDYLIVFFSDRA